MRLIHALLVVTCTLGCTTATGSLKTAGVASLVTIGGMVAVATRQ